MWKKSHFSTYKKVEHRDEDVGKHTFNYQKLIESRGETSKQRRSASPMSSFVPPVFPVVPHKFMFFG